MFNAYELDIYTRYTDFNQYTDITGYTGYKKGIKRKFDEAFG